MLLSFERTILVGAFAVADVGAMLLHLNGLVHAVLPESKNMCKRTFGFSKNLRDPVVSSAISRLESPGNQLQASAAGLVRRGAKTTRPTEVPPSEGNEARWDGRQEVIVP
jgi:hypothetical protein